MDIAILARIDLLERRVAVLEGSRAQSLASLAFVNNARRAKREEMFDAIKGIVEQYPEFSAKKIIKQLIEIGIDPPDLPRLRTVQRLVQDARQSLGAAHDAEDLSKSPG